MARANDRKSIFITGAASGIGAETARYFAARGWFVGLFDINEAGLQSVLDEIGAENGVAGKLDVVDRAQWDTAIAAFGEATGGTMDVLFNNAGIARFGWFETIAPDEADKVVDINVKGVINGVYASLDLLKATKGSRIVNTASVAGIVGAPRLAVYAASKFAVRGLTEALDVEFREFGIRVTTLMPWFVDTPILAAGTTDRSNQNLAGDIKETGAAVYPVSMAAEEAWAAAHGEATHYTVGKDAKRAHFASRFFPKRLRKQLLKALPSRSDG